MPGRQISQRWGEPRQEGVTLARPWALGTLLPSVCATYHENRDHWAALTAQWYLPGYASL